MNAPITTPVAAEDAKNDTAIFAAWERYRAARIAYSALPDDDGPVIGGHTPAELEQLNIMDTAENEMQASIATTPEGIELILWMALLHTVYLRDDDIAARDRNLRYFLDRETDFDWNARVILTAIRSLRELGDAS